MEIVILQSYESKQEETCKSVTTDIRSEGNPLLKEIHEKDDNKLGLREAENVIVCYIFLDVALAIIQTVFGCENEGEILGLVDSHGIGQAIILNVGHVDKELFHLKVLDIRQKLLEANVYNDDEGEVLKVGKKIYLETGKR